MQFIANPSRTERVEKEGSSLYDPRWLAGGFVCRDPEIRRSDRSSKGRLFTIFDGTERKERKERGVTSRQPPM